MAERYPCPYSITALMATMAAIQGVVFALCTERDWNQWKLGWNIRLLTVAYSVSLYAFSFFHVHNHFSVVGSLLSVPNITAQVLVVW